MLHCLCISLDIIMKNVKKNISFKRDSLFIGAVILYVFLVIFFVYVMRDFSREYVINEIDTRLLMTARSIQHILPHDYHDRALSPGSIRLNMRLLKKNLQILQYPAE